MPVSKRTNGALYMQRQRIATLEKESAKLHAENDALCTENTRLVGELNKQRVEIEEARERIGRMDQRYGVLLEENERLKLCIKSVNARNNELRTENARLQKPGFDSKHTTAPQEQLDTRTLMRALTLAHERIAQLQK